MQWLERLIASSSDGVQVNLAAFVGAAAVLIWIAKSVLDVASKADPVIARRRAAQAEDEARQLRLDRNIEDLIPLFADLPWFDKDFTCSDILHFLRPYQDLLAETRENAVQLANRGLYGISCRRLSWVLADLNTAVMEKDVDGLWIALSHLKAETRSPEWHTYRSGRRRATNYLHDTRLRQAGSFAGCDCPTCLGPWLHALATACRAAGRALELGEEAFLRWRSERQERKRLVGAGEKT